MGQAGQPQNAKPALVMARDPVVTERIFSDAHFDRLNQCCRIVGSAPLTRFDDASDELLADAEILLTSWGCPRIDRRVLARAPRLKLVAHAAGTVKSIIGREVFDAGVIVTNAVTANAAPVAEFTLAAILMANKQVFALRDLYRRERRDLRTHPVMSSGLGNRNKVVGIIGASRVGRRLIELLAPYDFTVLLYDPFVTPQEADALGVQLVMLDTLMARSDVATLHAPALTSTRHMIDARMLGLLRDGATFINTARGSLVDGAALERELVLGRIEAFIDVTDPEVLPDGSPLYELPNVFLTPHIAGSIGEERERLGDLAVSEIERFVAGQPLQHRVAPETLEHSA